MRIDPATQTVTDTFPLDNRTPTGLAVGLQAVWVAHGPRGEVSLVDPQFGTLIRTTKVAGTAFGSPNGSITLDHKSAWAVFGDSTLAHLDAAGKLLGTTLAGIQPAGVASASGSIWVTNSGEANVQRFNAATSAKGRSAPQRRRSADRDHLLGGLDLGRKHGRRSRDANRSRLGRESGHSRGSGPSALASAAGSVGCRTRPRVPSPASTRRPTRWSRRSRSETPRWASRRRAASSGLRCKPPEPTLLPLETDGRQVERRPQDDAPDRLEMSVGSLRKSTGATGAGPGRFERRASRRRCCGRSPREGGCLSHRPVVGLRRRRTKLTRARVRCSRSRSMYATGRCSLGVQGPNARSDGSPGVASLLKYPADALGSGTPYLDVEPDLREPLLDELTTAIGCRAVDVEDRLPPRRLPRVPSRAPGRALERIHVPSLNPGTTSEELIARGGSRSGRPRAARRSSAVDRLAEARIVAEERPRRLNARIRSVSPGRRNSRDVDPVLLDEAEDRIEVDGRECGAEPVTHDRPVAGPPAATRRGGRCRIRRRDGAGCPVEPNRDRPPAPELLVGDVAWAGSRKRAPLPSGRIGVTGDGAQKNVDAVRAESGRMRCKANDERAPGVRRHDWPCSAFPLYLCARAPTMSRTNCTPGEFIAV